MSRSSCVALQQQRADEIFSDGPKAANRVALFSPNIGRYWRSSLHAENARCSGTCREPPFSPAQERSPSLSNSRMYFLIAFPARQRVSDKLLRHNRAELDHVTFS